MPATPKTPRRKLGLGLGLFGAAVGIATAIWVSNATTGAASDCPVQPEAAATIDAVAQGELAALLATAGGRGYGDMAFKDAQGTDRTMADFAGKRLVVNFWATWCVPCREEMPELDALAQRYNSDDFEVVTINLDMGDDGPDKAQAFLDEFGLAALPLYADNTFRAFETLRNQAVAVGLPVTMLLDEEGCELAVLQGPADWDSADAHRVVDTLLAL